MVRIVGEPLEGITVAFAPPHSDLGKFASRVVCRRVTGRKQALKTKVGDYRVFTMTLDFGRYDRQHPVGMNSRLREQQKQQKIEARQAAFFDLIPSACQTRKSKNVCHLESGNAANECQSGQPCAQNSVVLKVVDIFGGGAMTVVWR